MQAVAAAEPGQAAWQIELGTTLADMGEINQALAYFQHAVELEPGSAPYWEILAQFCITNSLNLRTLGLPAARQAVLLAPRDPAALATMGWSMYALGDMQEAERFYLRALQANPDYALAHLHLGQVYLQENQYQLAYQHLRKALDLSANQPEIQSSWRSACFTNILAVVKGYFHMKKSGIKIITWLSLFSLVLAGCSALPILDNRNLVPSGGIFYADDFSNPKSGWPAWTDANGSFIDYQAGGLRMLVNQPQIDLLARPGVKF